MGQKKMTQSDLVAFTISTQSRNKVEKKISSVITRYHHIFVELQNIVVKRSTNCKKVFKRWAFAAHGNSCLHIRMQYTPWG